ncbi:hypothetical protein pmac_cds_289 [Pandoravirus macleodensis]|uniref:Uncharacterized protein n=1 Tax=Pandoravirus macleodensis TaxID=2107707 RepID=A0A2U7UEV9_9VIRU|nr:hypothetical protein pmac_cds_289 [Pandoravirus macleodensis]AVK76977.1 hypothetical protein pmac_cds_289 [Pandoravirus macleodensis]UMO79631.1 hypothetical protein [Pandoravirus aubagnensis]
MDLLRQAAPRLTGHARPATDGTSMPPPSTPRATLGVVDGAGAGPGGQAIVATPRAALSQPQHPLAAVRVEMASLAASINAAIVGMQASIDNLATRCARIEKRLGEESRRAAEGQRVVADHVESLWRAIDGSREAVNWCWARVTPATEGRAWLRARLVGHRQPQQQQQQQPPPHHHLHEHSDHAYARDGLSDKSSGAGGGGGDNVAESNDPDRGVGLVMDVGEGGWLCVRYPMVRAADDAGARCVWMRTTLVDEANGDMCHYWVKAYDLDAQMAFLCEYTNVPPCFDTEPLDDDDDDNDDGDDDGDDINEEGQGGQEAEGRERGGPGSGGGLDDGHHQVDAKHRDSDRYSGEDRGGASAHQRYHGARDEPVAPAPVILREGPHLNAIGRRSGDDHRGRNSGSEYDSDDFSSDGEPL